MTARDPLVDAVLLDRLRAGERSVFWELWRRHREALYRYCLRRHFEDPEDVEDALGEVMIEAWQTIPHCAETIQDVRAWLVGLAHNVCVDLRRAARGRPSPIEEDEGADRLAEEESEDPQALLLNRELQLYLLYLIERLPPSQRDPLVLHAFQDLSHGDIAGRLGITPENARKRVQLARDRLRDGLKDYLEGRKGVPWAGDEAHTSLEAQLESRLVAMQKGIDELLGRLIVEIPWQVVDIRVARVSLPSGVTLDYPVFLDQPIPVRPGISGKLRRYVEQHPGGWKKRLELGRRLYAMGDWEGAIEECGQILRHRPELLQVRVMLWCILHFMGRDAQALQVCEEAFRHAHQPATRHLFQGLADVCRGRRPAAARAFKRAMELEPAQLLHRYALGWVCLHLGRHLEALEVCESVLVQHPHDIMALLISVEALQVQGRWREVERRLQQAVDQDARQPVALPWLVTRRCDRRLVAGTEGELTECLLYQVLPETLDLAHVQNALAHLYACRGRWQRAVATMERLVAEQPTAPQGWWHLARWLDQTGRPREAAEAMLKACALYPLFDLRTPAVFVSACGVLARAGRRRELGELLARMLARFPYRWDVCAAAAGVLARAPGRPDEARPWAEEAVRLQPGLALPWLHQGQLLLALGSPREAVNALEQGWDRLPADGGADQAALLALSLGFGQRAAGEEVRARGWWEIARQSALRAAEECDLARGRHWLGQSLEALGDRAGALQAYQFALDHHLFHPERRDAQRAVKRLQDEASPAARR